MGKKVPMAHETLAEIKEMCKKILDAVGKEPVKAAPKPAAHEKSKF